MFHKTRKKIVLMITAVLLLFLTVTLTTIYGSSWLTLKNKNEKMLERYVELYSLETRLGKDGPDIPERQEADGAQALEPLTEPASEPPLLPEFPGGELYRLSSFYSAAVSDDGTILAIDAGRNGIYTEEEIAELAEEILKNKNKKNSGMRGNLMYRIDVREGYTLAAFMDTTLTDNNMRSVLLNTLVVGMAAIGFFFAFSTFLAKRIIRPLEENDMRQKQFVSDAGHELKTPIAVVTTNAELLARQVGENQWLANIQYENERMGNLVRELLELSHAENGDLIMEEIDLSKLTEQEVLPFESVAFEQGLVINSSISDGIVIRGNRCQLRQLLSILVDNAISHSEGGKDIDIELKKEYRQAVLTVANPGKEMPENVRLRIFDRFYRMDEARGESEGHFGLGLSIAKAITEAQKGKIQADWADGKVIFTVWLPAEK